MTRKQLFVYFLEQLEEPFQTRVKPFDIHMKPPDTSTVIFKKKIIITLHQS